MSVHIAFETPSDIQEQVYEMVKTLGKDGRGRLKKGANEVTKAAERGNAKMVVMAENVNPGELLAHIPMICREKEIPFIYRSEEHTSELQSLVKFVCRLLLEKKKSPSYFVSGQYSLTLTISPV